jgi:exodeoxyribonuclease VII large subunit
MDAPAVNTPEYSVSELAHALKRTVEDAYGYVRVRGEISGYKRAASGHVYLSLKDENAVIDAVMWKGVAGVLPFRPEDGLEVIATGKLTTYPGRSKYQIVIERMEPAGVGALLAQLEARKAKLAAEGLFDAARKQPLPDIPQVIGIITSPTGAVIRDILHRLADRFPRHVLVWPVVVQGDAAAGQVAAAIAGFNALSVGGTVPRPDLLIIARGGGSIEDLWAFNEEITVRAVAQSQIPIITAVGHETDTTLVDFVSDHRAPTPTAAAERAVPVLAELRLALAGLRLRADTGARRLLSLRAERLAALVARQPSVRALLSLRQQRFDDLADRLPRSLRTAAGVWRARLERNALRPRLLQQHRERAAADLARVTARLNTAATARHARDFQRLTAPASRLRPHLLHNRAAQDTARLASAARLLESLSPLNILARGYAVVRGRDGRLLTSAAAARAAVSFSLTFADDKVEVSTGVPVQGKLF